MAAINFITGKHSPIIMPDGTIRVLNFLTIEEEIELALNELPSCKIKPNKKNIYRRS